jgi:hypothetical protein
MANLMLVYGMRLFPAEEVAEVLPGAVKLQNGNTSNLTLHVLEGTREQIETQLRQMIEGFFDIYYPEE